MFESGIFYENTIWVENTKKLLIIPAKFVSGKITMPGGIYSATVYNILWLQKKSWYLLEGDALLHSISYMMVTVLDGITLWIQWYNTITEEPSAVWKIFSYIRTHIKSFTCGNLRNLVVLVEMLK